MLASLYQFSDNTWIKHPSSSNGIDAEAELVLCFGSKEQLKDKNVYTNIQKQFANANITICSTSGEIYQDSVMEDSLIAVALQFDTTTIKTASVNILDHKDSFEAAMKLAEKLPANNLSYVMIFSDGSLVNGSELVKGLNTFLGKDILITGGLAGDDANFKSTLVGLNEVPKEGEIIAIGFYGKNLLVTHGSQGGWEEFGLEKEITKSVGNVLYEINGNNALDLYKKYLGSEVENLPGSALLFPLAITVSGNVNPVVRTILSIDNEKKSMTFAGDVPEGSKLRFMKSNFENLTKAASVAAKQTLLPKYGSPDFVLLVSCVGRKLVLGPRLEDEVEAVNNTFGDKVIKAGFYSYGEISPFNEGGKCQLHNQTMTITSFYELP